MQAFLHGAPDGLRRDAMLFVVFHLFRPAIVRDRHERFHALRDCVSEEHDFAVYVSRRATRGLDERSLAPQKSFFICIENADERNFGKIETFAEQIDTDEDVEVGRAESAQNFDAFNRVDVAMQIAHFQSNIAQVIGQIFGGAFGQGCHQNSLILFHTLAAQLDCIVDLIFQRLECNFWIEQSGGPNDLFDHERRARRVRIEFFRRLVSARE